MKNRKLLISIVIVLLVVLVALITVMGVIQVNKHSTAKKYSSKIEKADKYLNSGDYENAILEYEKAIEIDEKNEDAYMKLAVAYMNMDDYAMAYKTLQQGWSMTESGNIRKMVQTYFGDDYQESDEKEKTYAVSINSTFVSQMAGFSYSDYEQQYGTPTVTKKSGKYYVSYSGVKAEFVYYNNAGLTVIDEGAGKPMSGAKPTEINVQTLELIFPGMGDTLDYSTLQTMELNGLNCDYNSGYKTYCVTFEYSGCNFAIASTEDGTISKTSQVNSVKPVNRKSKESDLKLEGSVKSATTGKGIDNASMIFRSGKNQTGSGVAECKTTSSGYYSVNLDAGDYTVEISKDGYSEEFFEVRVNDWQDVTNEDFVISESLMEGQIRIVLTWGEMPRDLDSYLEGKTDSGLDIDVNFRNREIRENNEIQAQLDTDERDGRGPETITLYNLNGKYTYRINDFHHTGTLGTSDATIKVYLPNSSTPKTYKVPAQAVNEWTVFEIDHGQIKDINKVG